MVGQVSEVGLAPRFKPGDQEEQRQGYATSNRALADSVCRNERSGLVETRRTDICIGFAGWQSSCRLPRGPGLLRAHDATTALVGARHAVACA